MRKQVDQLARAHVDDAKFVTSGAAHERHRIVVGQPNLCDGGRERVDGADPANGGVETPHVDAAGAAGVGHDVDVIRRHKQLVDDAERRLQCRHRDVVVRIDAPYVDAAEDGGDNESIVGGEERMLELDRGVRRRARQADLFRQFLRSPEVTHRLLADDVVHEKVLGAAHEHHVAHVRRAHVSYVVVV